MNNYIFTSESVSEGHPDKIADQISDALVDAGLKHGDETSRIAIETLVTTNLVVLAGEVKNFNVSDEEVKQIVRNKVRDIGYEQDGFHWDRLEILNRVHSQSADIALGTDDFGAGVQGIMFGYACNDNDAFMPAPIYYAHEILKELKEVRLLDNILGPDAKAQVSVEYEGGAVKRIDQVVISTQHIAGEERTARGIAQGVAQAVLGDLIDENTVWHLNPTGSFVIGGPDGDTGVTGRKIIVDTYGGAAPHGGGAFSGKDPSKVDRSAAYAARYVAKNIVAAGLAEKCLVQLSYAIGVAKPTSVMVDTLGTGTLADEEISNLVLSTFDLRPKGIVEMLDHLRPIYKKTAAYGHFGRDEPDFTWESLDKKIALMNV